MCPLFFCPRIPALEHESVVNVNLLYFCTWRCRRNTPSISAQTRLPGRCNRRCCSQGQACRREVARGKPGRSYGERRSHVGELTMVACLTGADSKTLLGMALGHTHQAVYRTTKIASTTCGCSMAPPFSFRGGVTFFCFTCTFLCRDACSFCFYK